MAKTNRLRLGKIADSNRHANGLPARLDAYHRFPFFLRSHQPVSLDSSHAGGFGRYCRKRRQIAHTAIRVYAGHDDLLNGARSGKRDSLGLYHQRGGTADDLRSNSRIIRYGSTGGAQGACCQANDENGASWKPRNTLHLPEFGSWIWHCDSPVAGADSKVGRAANRRVMCVVYSRSGEKAMIFHNLCAFSESYSS